ncbi:hypothetical protein BC828DRAFT_375434 [Blastocladiella britannica]|nr:hypothetical protein BC828DRAFT_375434 [Blastocladiella britannica]
MRDYPGRTSEKDNWNESSEDEEEHDNNVWVGWASAVPPPSRTPSLPSRSLYHHFHDDHDASEMENAACKLCASCESPQRSTTTRRPDSACGPDLDSDDDEYDEHDDEYDEKARPSMAHLPQELLLRIAHWLPPNPAASRVPPAADPLLSLAATCRELRAVLLNDRSLVRGRLRVDLSVLAGLVDDARLGHLVATGFEAVVPRPLSQQAPCGADGASLARGWVRELDLGECAVASLSALATPHSHQTNAMALPALRHLSLARTPWYYPAQQLRPPCGHHFHGNARTGLATPPLDDAQDDDEVKDIQEMPPLSMLASPRLAWLSQLRSLSLAHTQSTDDRVLHALARHWAPQLVDLDLAFCDHISDAGVACLLRARCSKEPLEQLVLTGCVRIEGHAWAGLAPESTPVRRLGLKLTSVTADSLRMLAAAATEEDRRGVLRHVDIRSCGFVEVDEARALKTGVFWDRSIVLVI